MKNPTLSSVLIRVSLYSLGLFLAWEVTITTLTASFYALLCIFTLYSVALELLLASPSDISSNVKRFILYVLCVLAMSIFGYLLVVEYYSKAKAAEWFCTCGNCQHQIPLSDSEKPPRFFLKNE